MLFSERNVVARELLELIEDHAARDESYWFHQMLGWLELRLGRVVEAKELSEVLQWMMLTYPKTKAAT